MYEQSYEQKQQLLRRVRGEPDLSDHDDPLWVTYLSGRKSAWEWIKERNKASQNDR